MSKLDHTNLLIEHMTGKNVFSKKIILNILKSKNYNPNAIYNGEFGFIFYFTEFHELQLLKHLIKHPDIDLSINIEQVIYLLILHNEYRFLRFFLKSNKEILKTKYDQFFTILFKQLLIEESELKQFITLKYILMYYAIVEDKLEEKQIKHYVNTLSNSNLTFDSLMTTLKIKNSVDNF